VSTAGKVLETFSQVLGVVALARFLGPRDYGRFALALTIVTVLSQSISVGGSPLMARFIPSVAPEERRALARRLAGRLGRWRALEVTLFAEACAVATLADPDTFAPLACALIVLALAFDVAATLLFQVDLGLGRVGRFSFRFAMQNLILVAASAALFGVAGSDGALGGIVVSSCLVFAWGALTVGRELARTPAGPRVENLAPIWRFGAYQMAGGLFAAIVQRGAVVAAAALGASKVQTGFAALGLGIGLAGTYVVGQAFAVNLPALADLARRDAAAAEAAAVALARRVLALVAPLTLAAAALVPFGVPLVLGDGFRGAEAAIYVGLAMMPLAPATALLINLAALRLARRQILLSRAVGVVVFFAVAVVAIPRWHGVGATVAVLASTAAVVASARLELGRGASWALIGAGALASGAVLGLGVAA
jgi:O-antigen/teichoic acid export membrane protein